MCDPATASIALAGGAKLIQGFSDYSTGQTNAKIAKAEGRAASNAATEESNRINDQGRQYLGTQAVSQATSGVDISQGSPADVAAASAKNIELDRLNTLYKGALQKSAKDYEATQYKRQGIASLAGGVFGAGASILAGGNDAGWFK